MPQDSAEYTLIFPKKEMHLGDSPQRIFCTTGAFAQQREKEQLNIHSQIEPLALMQKKVVNLSSEEENVCQLLFDNHSDIIGLANCFFSFPQHAEHSHSQS